MAGALMPVDSVEKHVMCSGASVGYSFFFSVRRKVFVAGTMACGWSVEVTSGLWGELKGDHLWGRGEVVEVTSGLWGELKEATLDVEVTSGLWGELKIRGARAGPTGSRSHLRFVG